MNPEDMNPGDLIASVPLTPELEEFLGRTVRGQGGHQSLLLRLQGSVVDGFLLLTREDLEDTARYGFRYGRGGFQQRLQAIALAGARSVGASIDHYGSISYHDEIED